MQIEEIKERIRLLRNVRQTFIDLEEWTNVSEVQYEIDQLLQAEARAKKPKIELWFQVAFMEFVVFPMIQAEVAKLIYSLEWEEKLKNQKP